MGAGRYFASLSAAVLGGLLIVGCQSAPPRPPAPAPPPPVSSADVARVQMMMQRHDRDARAGSVVRTRPDSKLAAIQLAPSMGTATTPIREDDAFTVTDSAQTPVANGRVVSVEHGVVVINYVPVPGGREPTVGDLAVHLSVGG